jgi:hypothetical protein
MSKGRVHDDSQDRAKAGSLNGHNRKQILSCVHNGSFGCGPRVRRFCAIQVDSNCTQVGSCRRGGKVMAWRIVDYGVHALLVASGAHLIRHFRRNDRPIEACPGGLRMRDLALNSRNRKAVGRRRLACCRLKRVESFCWLGTEPETSKYR